MTDTLDTATSSSLRTLTTEELDAASGGSMHMNLNLGLLKVAVSITSAGASGAISFLGGDWHGGTVWF